jgi:diacylglycerol kinase family enzyme
MYLGVVVNPRARKNRVAPDGRVDRLRRLVGPWGEVHETASVDALAGVVARLRPRASHLISDGGDGALHWLINEFLTQERDPRRWPTFVPTNGGSIDFVARKAHVRGRADAILTTLAAAAQADRRPPEVELDTLELRGETVCGTAVHRIGFALAAGGVGNRFFDKFDEHPRSGRVTMARVIARAVAEHAVSVVAQRQSTSHLFIPTPARVTIDGHEVPTRTHNALHAGALDVNLGGVLRVFPLAREPGVLHFQAGAIPAAHMIANLPALMSGNAIRSARLRDVAGREMVIEAERQPLSPVVDGERFDGITRLTVRPGPCIRVGVPAKARPDAVPR